MPVSPIYYRAPANTIIQSMALANFSGGVMLPVWTDLDAWNLTSGVMVQSPVSGLSQYTTMTSGFSAMAVDTTSGNAYMSQHVGSLVEYAINGSLSLYTLPSGSGNAYNGVTWLPAQNSIYLLDSGANLYNLVSGVVTPLSPFPAFGSHPAFSLAASGTTLYTILAAVSGIGTFTLSSALVGTSGVIPTPMPNPLCLAVNAASGLIVAGGWSNYAVPSGSLNMSYNIEGATPFLVNLNTASVQMWSGTANGGWTFVTSTSAVAAPTYAAWQANNLGVLVSDTTHNTLYVLSYISQTFSVAQTFSGVTNASNVATTPDNLYAFVSQPSANQISIYRLTTTWASYATLPITQPSTLLVQTATSILAGFASGVATLNLIGSTWTNAHQTTLPFRPISLVTDTYSNIYTIGNVASSGYWAVISSGGTLAASGAVSGAVFQSCLYQQGQFSIIDTSGNLLRTYGASGTTLSQVLQSTTAIPSGATSMTFSTPNIVIGSSGQISQFKYVAPYTVEPLRSGVVSIYTGTWNSYALGPNQWPEAIAFDPVSGTIDVVTFQNTLYVITSGAALVSATAIPQQVNQPAATPIGTSKLIWNANKILYGATSLNDSLVQIFTY